MEKIIVISNRGDLSPALLASHLFYEIRQENGKTIDILCLSPKKSFFSWHSDAEKMKEILTTLGIGDHHIETREENSIEDCILSAFNDVDLSDTVWCVPAGMNILIKRKALQIRQKALSNENFREDNKISLSKKTKERKKQIRNFSLKLIAEKLVGPGDTILGRYLSTGIIWNDGRPTFKMAEKPYGIQ